ncbi:MAG: SUMF1/EgtB/PvdO family nonheme iron enzyme [Magnetococcales bacterium]|nr:SUMF1/EgtB/PvdO family nonheme iron enzyme [Magnetococcales bacterium]
MERSTALVGRYIVREVSHHNACPHLIPADDTSSGLLVDLQWLPAAISNDPLHMATVRHNMQLLHALNHPHIARLHALEFDPLQRRHFLVWEHLNGVSLQEYRLSLPGQRLSCPEAMRLCQPVAEALDSLHRSLLHRHLRPETLFLTDDGTIKLGCIPLIPTLLLRQLQQKGELPGPLDSPRELAYQAPEQLLQPHREATPASDRWAFAVLFYELINASLPLTETEEQAGKPGETANIAPVAGLNRAGQQVLARALARHATDRFPSAQAFLSALAAVAASRKSRSRRLLFAMLLLGVSSTALLWHDPIQTLLTFIPSPAVSKTEPENHPEAPVLTPDLKKTLLLQIESQPAGARVILDGKPLGLTPLTVGRVAPGAYHLWLEKEQYKTVEMEMDLTQDTIVSLNLEPLHYPSHTEGRSAEMAALLSEKPLRTFPVPEQEDAVDPLTVPSTISPAADAWVEPETGITFIPLPGGCFNMGSSQGDLDESPAHTVCVAPFWLAQHEVTQAAWKKIMHGEENPSRFRQRESLPVDSVSWHQAQRFIERLNGKSRFRFRLPSEAEWEYACRAGLQSSFQFGNTIHAGKANFNGERQIGQETKGYYAGTTLPVGSYVANRFGLFDMHGNLYEWVADVYQADYYQKSLRDNPLATSDQGEQAARVLRGGAWYSTPHALRCAARHKDDPQQQNHGYGFRLLRDP